MNQQEIDRLFEQHTFDRYLGDQRIMYKQDFAQAAAEIRRQVLEEAAKEAERLGPMMEEIYGFGSECISTANDISRAIRLLVQNEQGSD